MGRGKSKKNRDDSSSNIAKQQQNNQGKTKKQKEPPALNQRLHQKPNDPSRSMHQSGLSTAASFKGWCLQERQGIVWVLGCAFLGSLFGFGIGSGFLTGEGNKPPNAWRVALGARIRSSATYEVLTLNRSPWSPSHGGSFFQEAQPLNSRSKSVVLLDAETLRSDPSHSTVYAVLREAVVREMGGYVHPDLGILSPAPCGSARGLGMVRDSYHRCQTKCLPGIAEEKRRASIKNTTSEKTFMQEELLIKAPLAFQMTRTAALETLMPLISPEVQQHERLYELDDAALLTLLLAHERGVGKYSRWLPYIASLPLEPSCGYSKNLRPYLLDSINALREELGVDISGWPGELLKATQYADRIANALSQDYGSFLQHPKGVSQLENIEWALCQVASRAIAGSQKHGSLRLIPLVDLINHDNNAAGFVELTGEEKVSNGDFVDSILEEDSGAFAVRSRRHGRRKALKVGQELLINYNVPHYSPLDWFVSVGFVPPERWAGWEKIDSALPKIRMDGPFGASNSGRAFRSFISESSDSPRLQTGPFQPRGPGRNEDL
ncbi:unnamed protein product [Cylindrotheca closterium]|uniref:SET domain-containing protein n=1 Tax=Cylindrotheca closterium TaxID=2856 RepID=A0AAD2CS28_9STRA|nr:unnamed protein product [Cylindrotheca closterium]